MTLDASSDAGQDEVAAGRSTIESHPEAQTSRLYTAGKSPALEIIHDSTRKAITAKPQSHRVIEMPIEICRTTTRDELFLDGVLAMPDAQVLSALPVDVFLLVHGTGSNFYTSGVLETFASQSLSAGVAALRINTRGHDTATFISGPGGSKRGGAAYELIYECRHDLQAWLEYLTQRGFQRIALVGHSMGGVKSIYSQAHDPHPGVQCVIGISPPRFCHANFMSHPKGKFFREDFARAEQLLAADRGDQLIDVRQPLPLTMTAAGYLAKYGPHDEYDLSRWLPKLICPMLLIIGAESVATSPAFDGFPETISNLSKLHPHIALEIVEGANTPYSSCPNLPFQLTERWLLEMADSGG